VRVGITACRAHSDQQEDEMATSTTPGSAWQEDAASASQRTGGNGAGALSESAAATVDKVAGGAHQAVDRIAAAANTAASQFGVKGEELMAAKDRLLESAREYVREKPVTALAIALAAGFILSRLSR
jgi:ElaB/YqjD/DUF883 family membrane-anchored ribosome-binding protein